MLQFVAKQESESVSCMHAGSIERIVQTIFDEYNLIREQKCFLRNIKHITYQIYNNVLQCDYTNIIKIQKSTTCEGALNV